MFVIFFFFKQKTAYELRISDWSSDVFSSDLPSPRSRCSASRTPRSGSRRGRRRGGRPVRRASATGARRPAAGRRRRRRRARARGAVRPPREIGRAHVCTPVTNAHLVCRLLLDKQNAAHTTTQL